MKLAQLKSITFSLLLIAVMFSCTKEKIVTLEKEYSWKQHDHFLHGHQIQMNSYVASNDLFMFGTTLFSKFTANSTDSSQINLVTSYLRSPYPIQRRLPISEVNNAIATESYITIRSNKDYLWGLTRRGISMPTIDSNFWRFDFPPYWMSECMLLNGHNQCLVPYNTFIPNTSNSVTQNARFCILEIHRDAYNEILDTLIPVPIPIDSNLGGVLSLHTIDGNFYACLSNATLRITPTYEVTQVSNEKLYQVFKYRGALYGLGYTYLYKSTNNGLSWFPLLQVSENAYRNNYAVIDDELLAFKNDQILHLTITDNKIEQKEILNDGLEGDEITSLSLFKGKVYITSFSGVFTKDYSTFFTYK